MSKGEVTLKTPALDSKAPVRVSWLLMLSVWAMVTGAIVVANPNLQWSEKRTDVFGADYLQEWIGARILSSTDAAKLYDQPTFQRWQHDTAVTRFAWPDEQYFPPVYPPPHYLFAKCLAWLPYRAATYVWFALLFVSYPLAIWIIESSPVTPRRSQAALFWTAAVLFPAVLRGWTMGQKGTLFLLLLAIAWRSWTADRKFWSGFVFGLLVVKPTLFFLLPVVLLVRKEWRFVAGTAASVTGILAVTGLLVPANLWFDYLRIVGQATAYQASSGYEITWSANLWGLLHGFSSDSHGLQKYGLIAGILATMWIARKPPTGAATHQCLMAVAVATILLSPHLYFYDLVVLLLPLRLLETRQSAVFLAVIWAAMAIGQLAMVALPLLPISLSLVLLMVLVPATRWFDSCRTLERFEPHAKSVSQS
ncbi:MAG: glycosyltransferase family 87 protein [Pirellulaceae bacterium]